MRYEIERYHPDLKPKVIKLQRHLWSANLALNTSYFEWKYEKNPYLAEPLIYLALHNGEPIGMRGFSGVQWQCGRPVQRFSGLYADDMGVAPEHRGSGLMAKIMTAAFKDLQTSGYDYIFNLSAGDVTLRSSLQLGWRSAGWLAPMRRPASISSRLLRRVMRLRFLDKIARFSAAPPRRWLAEIDLVAAQKLLQRTPQIFLEDQPRCLDMSHLIERIGHTGRISHVRNTEYFQWRFQNPLSRYRFLFWLEPRLEGYVVLQEYTSENDLRDAINIVDWEASHPSIKKCLLDAVLSAVPGAPIVMWSAGLGRQEIEMLQKNRFQLPNSPRDPSPPAILVRPVKHSPSEDKWKLGDLSLLALDNWDMRMLYSMAG